MKVNKSGEIYLLLSKNREVKGICKLRVSCALPLVPCAIYVY